MDAAAVVADCAREARRDDEGFGMREDLGLKNAGSIYYAGVKIKRREEGILRTKKRVI